MTDTWADLARFAIGLFALLNPFASLPYAFFAAGNQGKRGVLILAATSTATMIFILLAMHIMGEAVLTALGTSLASFQIGGGLVMLLGGLSMLSAPTTATAEGAGDDAASTRQLIKLGVAPLGIPMLAGAGAITKVIIETQPHYGLEDGILIGITIVAVCLLCGAIVAASSLLMRVLGPAFFSVLTRLSGLVIVAVAVEGMSMGVFAHVKAFSGG